MLIMSDDIKHLLTDSITKRIIRTSNQIYRVLEEISNYQGQISNFLLFAFYAISDAEYINQ